jgi:diguanylate cyclase (GGDEF)-like protein
VEVDQIRRGVRGTALVVSDAPDIGRRLAGALRAAGVEVLRTGNGIEALALTDVVRPQVVLVDAGLPGLESLCAQLAAAAQPGQALLVCAPDDGAGADLPAGCEVVRFDPAAPAAVVRRVEALVAEGNDLRAASPLTGLPGNAAIRLELGRRLAAGGRVGLAYLDIDGFKPFNDRYGFLRGDEVLRAVADLLEREAARRPGSFVGHVGGDDFVLLAPPDDVERMATAVVAAFDALAPSLYDPEDAERGYLEGEDRRGQRVRHPLLTLSVGIASNRYRRLTDPLALVDLATEMKHVAKQREGSAVATDRRVPGAPGDRRGPLGGWARRRHGRLRAWLRRAAAVAAGLLVLTLPAAGVAAAGSAPGDRLWPAARLLEDARLALAGEDRPALHVELADDRLADLLTALSAGDADRAVLAATEYARHVRGGAADPGPAGWLDRHMGLLERLEQMACTSGGARACSAVAGAERALAQVSAASRRGPGGAAAGEPARGAPDLDDAPERAGGPGSSAAPGARPGHPRGGGATPGPAGGRGSQDAEGPPGGAGRPGGAAEGLDRTGPGAPSGERPPGAAERQDDGGGARGQGGAGAGAGQGPPASPDEPRAGSRAAEPGGGGRAADPGGRPGLPPGSGGRQGRGEPSGGGAAGGGQGRGEPSGGSAAGGGQGRGEPSGGSAAGGAASGRDGAPDVGPTPPGASGAGGAGGGGDSAGAGAGGSSAGEAGGAPSGAPGGQGGPGSGG